MLHFQKNLDLVNIIYVCNINYFFDIIKNIILILDELTPEFLTRRVTCGSMPGYYPSTDICLDYFDASTIPPIIGGCKWDLGIFIILFIIQFILTIIYLLLAVGYCADNTLKASTRGCASKVEDFLASGNL